MAPRAPPGMNPWEVNALEYEFPEQVATSPDGSTTAAPAWRQTQDPVIYPGIYSASGFDIMSILMQVSTRPNPQIELGSVDSSVAVILCDLEQPDCPIVYASDSFCELTGYARGEVMGRNCRFLQTPGGGQPPPPDSADDALAVQRMRHAVKAREEIQLPVTNYKKSGQRFTNLLSIVFVDVADSGHGYAVGFQVERD